MKNTNNLTPKVIVNFYDGAIERDGQVFKLEPLQVQLLDFFLTNPDENISRNTLSHQVWQSTFTSDDTINKAVSSVRKALSSQRDLFISTVPKVGYRFSIPTEIDVEVRRERIVALIPEVEAPVVEVAKTPATTLDETADNQMLEPIAAHACWNRNLFVFILIMMIGLLAVVVWLLSLSANNSDSKPVSDKPQLSETASKTTAKNPTGQSSAKSKLLELIVDDIELTDSNLLSANFTELLQEQILNDLALIKGVRVAGGNEQKNKAQVVLKSKLMVFDSANTQSVKLSLQLVDLASGTRLFSTMIDATIDNQQSLLEHLHKQAGAALRLGLVYPDSFKLYAKALKALNHLELEQLVLAENHAKRALPNGLEKALDILQRLNHDKPNTSDVLGLLAETHVQVALRLSGQYAASTLKVRGYAEQALAIDPSNFAALKAMANFYINTPHLKHKGNYMVNALLRYYPDQTATWRYRLYVMTLDARPCDEIKDFVDTIPKGLFSKARLNVIEQLLDGCESGDFVARAEQLWQLRKVDDSGKVHKALPRNLFLFDQKHDFMAEALTSLLDRRSGVKLLGGGYRIKLKMGDIEGASIIGEDIKRMATGYWLTSASFTGQAYAQQPLVQIPEFTTQELSLLDYKTNLFYVTHLVSSLNQPSPQTDVKQALLNYLEHQSKFEVAVNTRHESIALMMAQYGAGQLEQSRKTASRLSKQLNKYRNDSLNSYHFWNLGWFQIISDFYCGDACQPLALTQLFPSTQRWWTNNVGVARVALAPWADESLVKEYIDKIEQDRLRVRQRLGI